MRSSLWPQGLRPWSICTRLKVDAVLWCVDVNHEHACADDLEGEFFAVGEGLDVWVELKVLLVVVVLLVLGENRC